jgi:hypothetical protein
MKKLSKYSLLLFFSLFFIFSCSKEDDSKTEKIIAKVEITTLKELNKLMRENGLSEYTEEDILKFKKEAELRSTCDRQTWIDHGNWNNSAYFNSQDLVLARNYICANVGCYGNVNTTNTGNASAQNFGYLSALHSGSGAWDLNENDIQLGAGFIVGNICPQ